MVCEELLGKYFPSVAAFPPVASLFLPLITFRFKIVETLLERRKKSRSHDRFNRLTTNIKNMYPICKKKEEYTKTRIKQILNARVN
jgi:hypothetical protein